MHSKPAMIDAPDIAPKVYPYPLRLERLAGHRFPTLRASIALEAYTITLRNVHELARFERQALLWRERRPDWPLRALLDWTLTELAAYARFAPGRFYSRSIAYSFVNKGA